MRPWKYIAAVLTGAGIGLFYVNVNSALACNIFLSGFVFLISLLMMQRESGIFNLKRVSIPSFWYVTYLPMICIPAFMVYTTKPAPYRDTYLFSVVSVLLTVPLGVLAANRIWKFKPADLGGYFSAPVEKEDDNRRFVLFLIFLGMIILVLADYFSRIKIVPFFYMLTHPNDVQRLTLLREETFKLLDPRWSSSGSTRMFYIYLFLRTLIFPFLIVASLGQYLVNRQRKWLILFVVFLLLGISYAGSTIARAPVAAIFLRIACLAYIYKKGLLSRKALVIFVGLVLLFPTVVTALAYGSTGSFMQLVEKVVKRLSYSTAYGLYYYFEIFPDHHPFVYGQTLLKPFLQFFTKNFFYIENYVYKYAFPHGIPSGHENDAFISNFYADFGIIGVLAGGVIAGLLMQWIQIHLVRSKKDALNLATYAFMMYAFWVLNQGSLTSVLLVNGVVPVLLFVWLIRRMEKGLTFFKR